MAKRGGHVPKTIVEKLSALYGVAGHFHNEVEKGKKYTDLQRETSAILSKIQSAHKPVPNPIS